MNIDWIDVNDKLPDRPKICLVWAYYDQDDEHYCSWAIAKYFPEIKTWRDIHTESTLKVSYWAEIDKPSNQ